MFEGSLLARIDYDTPLPSFVELQLGKYIKQSVRQALDVTWQIAADRFPVLLPTLPFRKVALTSGAALVEASLLYNGDQTFSEWLLMQRRERLELVQTPDPKGIPPSGTSLWNMTNLMFAPLDRSGRLWSLAEVTLFPWMYEALRSRYDELLSNDADVQQLISSREQRFALYTVFHRLLRLLFPLLHIAVEGSQFVFDIAYLLEKTPFASIWLWWHRIGIRRTRGGGSPKGRVLVYALLVVASYGIRLFQTSFRRSNGTGGPVVVLPPPSTVNTAVGTTSAALIAGECPVCKRSVTNPATNVASGSVGCFPCLQSYIEEHGTCPGSGVASSVLQLRRLYEG